MVKTRITEAVTASDAKSQRWRSLLAAGRMAYETGEFRQAESLLTRAMELAKEIPDAAFAMSATDIGIAAVWVVSGRGREAQQRLTKVVATLEGRGDAMQKELLGVALRFLAQATADQGDEREAEKLLRRSAQILGEVGIDACVQLAYTLSDLAGLYLLQGRISEAEQNITDSLQILGAVTGAESPEYIRADMIYKLCTPCSVETMLENASDGIQKMEYFFGYKHPNIERALKRYMRVLTERGDTARLDETKKRFGLNKVAGNKQI